MHSHPQVIYAKAYNRNEALDLTVYCHAGPFALQHFIAPVIYRDLGKLGEIITQGQSPDALRPRARRFRSAGLT